MSLDDFIEQDGNSSSDGKEANISENKDDVESQDEKNSLETDKRVEDVQFNEPLYKYLLTAHPTTITTLCSQTDEESKKAIVRKADEIIENGGGEELHLNSKDKRMLAEERDEAVEEFNLGEKRYKD